MGSKIGIEDVIDWTTLMAFYTSDDRLFCYSDN